MKYDIQLASQFKKDIKKAKLQKRDLNKLLDVIKQLEIGKTLDTAYKDHMLIGNYNNFRECHIEPDWLLIYRIFEDEQVLMLYRLGTHSELF